MSDFDLYIQFCNGSKLRTHNFFKKGQNRFTLIYDTYARTYIGNQREGKLTVKMLQNPRTANFLRYADFTDCWGLFVICCYGGIIRITTEILWWNTTVLLITTTIQRVGDGWRRYASDISIAQPYYFWFICASVKVVAWLVVGSRRDHSVVFQLNSYLGLP